MTNAYTNFRRKRPIKRPGEREVDGIIILKYIITETSRESVGLAQDWATCGDLVDTIVDLLVPQKTENALTDRQLASQLQEFVILTPTAISVGTCH
jgi:hypothetical protein